MRKKVTMYVLPEHYERIKGAADQLQMPISTYLRFLIEKLYKEEQTERAGTKA
jgi:predicted DNA-binding protein